MKHFKEICKDYIEIQTLQTSDLAEINKGYAIWDEKEEEKVTLTMNSYKLEKLYKARCGLCNILLEEPDYIEIPSCRKCNRNLCQKCLFVSNKNCTMCYHFESWCLHGKNKSKMSDFSDTSRLEINAPEKYQLIVRGNRTFEYGIHAFLVTYTGCGCAGNFHF